MSPIGSASEKETLLHMHDDVCFRQVVSYLRPRSQYDKLPTVTPAIDPLLLMSLAGGTPLTAHTCIQTKGVRRNMERGCSSRCDLVAL